MTTGEPDPSFRTPRIDLSEYETAATMTPLEIFMGGLGLLSDAQTIDEMDAVVDVVTDSLCGPGDISQLGNVEKPGMLLEPVPTFKIPRATSAFKIFATVHRLGVFDDLDGANKQALETYIAFQSRLRAPSVINQENRRHLHISAYDKRVASRQAHPYPLSAAEFRAAARRDVRLARVFGLKWPSALMKNVGISLGMVVPPIKRKIGLS